METAREMLEEFEHAAPTIAEVESDNTSWAQLCPRVIDLIQRGSRTVALIDESHSETSTTIRWDQQDTAVMVARAFGIVHRRLAAVVAQAARAGDRTVGARPLCRLDAKTWPAAVASG